MREEHAAPPERAAKPVAAPAQPQAGAPWQAPRFEVISLDCEISAYAPAGDEPLF